MQIRMIPYSSCQMVLFLNELKGTTGARFYREIPRLRYGQNTLLGTVWHNLQTRKAVGSLMQIIQVLKQRPKNENRVLEDYDPNSGYRNKYNNRSLRVYEMMEGKYANKEITYEDFKDIKFDHTYPQRMTYRGQFWLDELFDLDAERFPEIADAIGRINAFDKTADTLDRNFPILLMTIYELLDYNGKKKSEAVSDKEVRTNMFAECVKMAKEKLIERFGTIDIATRELQVLERNGKSVAVAGGPDVLRAVFGSFMEDGRNRMQAGDGYIQLVQFTDDGPLIESINAFGSSIIEGSPHNTDQMVPFAQHKLKKMSLDKEEVYRNAKRIYHPE